MDVEPLEASPSNYVKHPTSSEPDVDSDGSCIICLQRIVDRTVLQCAHDHFCFECAILWTKQSRKCPLCSIEVGTYVIHQIRSKHDYQKYYLPPLITPLEDRHALQARVEANVRRRLRPIQWGRRGGQEEAESPDALERAIEKRRWVYRNRLYAKHVASNSYSKHRPCPTPAQFNTSEELISRATAFIRRELQVWVNIDIQFLTTFFISLLRTMDLRSEPAVRAIAEFLDLGGKQYREGDRQDNAEHFAHELYAYLRSPYRDLSVYDSIIQYDKPFEYRRRGGRNPRWSPPHSPRTSSLPRRPRHRTRSHSPVVHQYPSSPSSSSNSSASPQNLEGDTLINQGDKHGHGQSAAATNAPPRKTRGQASATPAGDNLSERDHQVVFSGTIFEATGNIPKGEARGQPSQGCDENEHATRSDLSPSRQITSDYGSNLASSADRSTTSPGRNAHPFDQSLACRGPDRPRELSIRNAARRLRVNVTRQVSLLPQEPALDDSSTLVKTSIHSSTVSSVGEELATGKGAIVSAPSRPVLKVGSDAPRRCRVIQSVKTGENSSASDTGTGVEGARPSPESHVIAASDTKVSGATRSLDSSTVRSNEARLRLLRARIAAGKELERTLTTNSNNRDVSSRAVPHETASVTSLSAGMRTDTLAAGAVRAAPGTLAIGDLATKTQGKPLSEEEAALRRILVQRRASAAAAGGTGPRS